MAIVGGFDVHRRQITFDYWDSDTARVERGRVRGCRQVLRTWLEQHTSRPNAVTHPDTTCTTPASSVNRGAARQANRATAAIAAGSVRDGDLEVITVEIVHDNLLVAK